MADAPLPDDHYRTELERIFSILDMARHRGVIPVDDQFPHTTEEKLNAAYAYLDALLTAAESKDGKARRVHTPPPAKPPAGVEQTEKMLDWVISHKYAVNTLGGGLPDKARVVCDTLIKVTNASRKVERLLQAMYPGIADEVLACLSTREAKIGDQGIKALVEVSTRLKAKAEGAPVGDPEGQKADLLAKALDKLLKGEG